jgi:hypothetical protein
LFFLVVAIGKACLSCLPIAITKDCPARAVHNLGRILELALSRFASLAN